jgi:hypothetical protein
VEDLLKFRGWYLRRSSRKVSSSRGRGTLEELGRR